MPIIPPGVPAVRTVAVGGPSGPQGVPGQSAIQRVAASAMAAGQVVRTHAAGQQMQPATSELRTRPFDAILLGDIGSGATGNFHVAGPVPANVLQLGAGVACAVGVDVNGRPVRATDPACVSAPNWVGTCDALGNVTILPLRKDEFNVLDWGLDPTGVVACDDLFDTLLAQTSTGDSVLFPRGNYKFTRTINMPRVQMGIEIRGIIGNPGHGIFTPTHPTLTFSNAEGDGIRACTDPTTNSHGFLTIRNLTIHQSNPANRTWDSPATDAWLKGGAGIGMIGGQRLEVLGVEFTGEWRFGIAIDGGEQCKIEDVDCRNFQSPQEIEGEQSFGVWLADGNRGMSVTGATNVIRIRRVYGNAPSFLFLLNGTAANTIADCMTNINPYCIAGFAMISGGSYTSIKNGYAEGDNAMGSAMFYFCGGQSINLRIEGGFYTGVGVAFAKLGPNPFSPIAGQAAGLEFHGVDLACDWVVGSGYINNCHMSIGNLCSGDISTLRNGQMYDVEPGHTTGLIANTGQATGYFMGTAGNPKAQHHWALKQYASALHLDGTEPFRFREFWADSISRFRTLHHPYSSLTGIPGHSDVCIAYEYTDGTDVNTAPLAVGDRTYGVALATVSMILGGEAVGAAYQVRQRFRRLPSGDVELLGSPVTIWSDSDGGFTAPSFAVDTGTDTIMVHLTHRNDGQIYHAIKHEILAVHP